MDAKTRARLEEAGYRFGDAADFLGLTDDERALVELRVAVSRAVRRLREEQQLTPKDLAARLKVRPSWVPRIELGTADVSLDLLFRGLFVLGGTLADASPPPPRPMSIKRKGQPAVV